MVVIGNCQSRPLAVLFSKLNPNIEITAIAVVHLLKTHQFDEYRIAFEEADIIVAQSVADNYPCEFVRTSFLDSNYSKKLVKILNLYYTGYTPDWAYIRTKDKKPLKGPMGDYHNQTIFEGWRTGLTINETVQRMEDLAHNQIYANAATDSLQELKKREKNIDVVITDFMSEQVANNRLFFTINHPSHKLLEEYAKRILDYCNIPIKNPSITLEDEPLGQFRPRVNPIATSDSNSDPYHYGIDISGVSPVRNRKYTSIEIAHLFYELYDKNKEQL